MVRGNNSHWRRWEMSLKLALKREPQTQQGEVQLRIKVSQQWRYLLQRVAFLLGLWTLLVQFANKREANTGLEQRNKSKKLLTLLEQPSCLTASHRELKNRAFPQVFAHCKPIRRRHLRSHDSYVGCPQSDARASQWRRWPLNLMYFHP